MAIYHLSAKPVQRAKGRSATASSAYRAGVCLDDDRTGEIHDYTRKKGVEHSEIITPKGEKIDRQELWNKAEKAEKRKDGTPAREYEIALPSELSKEEQKDLVRAFAKDLASRHGCAVDMAIHEPNRKGDERNFHAHLLCTTRHFENGELHKKCDVELSDTDRKKKGLDGRKNELEKTRNIWATMCNTALEKAGHDVTIDARSFENQGIKRQPTMHMGVTATAMERKGKETDRKREAPEPDTSKKLKELEAQEQGMSRARQNMKEWQEDKAKAKEAERARQQHEQALKLKQEQEQAKIQQAERAKQQEERQKARDLERENRPKREKSRGMER